MTSYYAWNDSLAARFFRPDLADAPVHFFVTEDVVEEVGRASGDDYAGFLSAVRGGPPGFERAGHCQRALQVAQDWRERGFSYPPYIAYLGLFVLAGGHEGDFAPQSYYPRLWELLGEPGAGTPPSFERMLELWDDLEKWSVRDRHGELGLFEARIVGGKIHIGLPLAQTVLTGAERHALPRIFAAASLDPGRAPSTRELRRALSVHGRPWLRPRTVSGLERGSDGYLGALLDVVADDFLAWDGTTADTDERDSSREVHAGLRLCLALDRVAGTLRATVRCRSKKDLPEDGLRLASSGEVELQCAQFVPGWSTPLQDAQKGAPFEPPHAAWQAGLRVSDPTAGWQMRLAAARLRVFVEGRHELLPGLVESLELPQDGPFYLAFAPSAAPTIEPWLSSDCDSWQPIEVRAGLPNGWILGSVSSARTDAGPRGIRPELGFPDRLSMRLVGGIRAAPGNSFFSFAPPKVALDGATPDDRLVCNNRVLKQEEHSSLYVLPDGLPVDTRVGLEVWRNDDAVRRASLYLLSGVPWRLERPILSVDSYGRASEAGLISGALVPMPPSEDPAPVDLLRTPGLPGSATRIYFIGRQIGQIAVWPDEEPPEWHAVWAIPFSNRGQAIFCGDRLEDAGPLPHCAADRQHLRLWRDVLWRRRRDISPPRDRALKLLWRRYRDISRG